MLTSIKKPTTKRVSKKKDSITKEILRRAYLENEKNNNHSDNAIMLVKEFGTPSQIKKAKAIEKAIQKRGWVELEESKWLNKFGHVHWKKIK